MSAHSRNEFGDKSAKEWLKQEYTIQLREIKDYKFSFLMFDGVNDAGYLAQATLYFRTFFIEHPELFDWHWGKRNTIKVIQKTGPSIETTWNYDHPNDAIQMFVKLAREYHKSSFEGVIYHDVRDRSTYQIILPSLE